AVLELEGRADRARWFLVPGGRAGARGERRDRDRYVLVALAEVPDHDADDDDHGQRDDRAEEPGPEPAPEPRRALAVAVRVAGAGIRRLARRRRGLLRRGPGRRLPLARHAGRPSGRLVRGGPRRRMIALI